MKNTVESVLIIGLGMIGSSIALASRSKGIKVYGYDLDSPSLKLALKEKIIDDLEFNVVPVVVQLHLPSAMSDSLKELYSTLAIPILKPNSQSMMWGKMPLY